MKLRRQSKSVCLHPRLLKEKFRIEKILGVVSFDGEKALEGLLRYTLLVWCSVHVCCVCAP